MKNVISNKYMPKILGLLFIFSLILAFVFPSYEANNLFNVDISKYIFLLLSIGVYIFMKKENLKSDIVLLIFIVIICLFQKSIYPLNLFVLIPIYEFVMQKQSVNKLINVKMLAICGLFILLYTILYFGHMGRYAYVGIREVNQSGFAILIFAILIRKKSKLFSNLILLFGFLTFSRNYFLCATIFLVCDLFKIKLPIVRFQYLAVFSIISLVLLSFLFQYKYDKNEISEYKTGVTSAINLFDYSNFHRFTVNTNLIEIYINNPQKLLTGLSDDDFYQLNYNLMQEKGYPYRKIKCHNYFFSYLKIYGIFSIIIFLYIGKIINSTLSKNNMHIFLVIFLYSTFLGIGLSSYWLYISILTLCYYNEKLEIEKQYSTKIDDVTILIKTFERYNALKRMLSSIVEKYPTAPIIIVDDSKKNYKDKILKNFKNYNIKYIVTEYDIGLSKGRNILLDNVETTYFLLCDDDFEFDSRTNIELALKLIKKKKLDILGGNVYNRITLTTLYSVLWCLKKISRLCNVLKNKEFISIYNGKFEINDNDIVLNVTRDYKKYNAEKIYNTDICSNFFIAKTDSIRKMGGWFEILKVGEHEIFFLDAKRHKLKIGYTSSFGVVHYPEKKVGYLKYRMRASNLFKKACSLKNINTFIIKDENNNLIYSYDKNDKC